MFSSGIGLVIVLVIVGILGYTKYNRKDEKYRTRRLDFETRKLELKNTTLLYRLKRFISQFH